MPKIKHVSHPGIVGAVTCVLFILSWIIANFTSAEWLSTVIQVVGLCVSVHMIRSTAKLYKKHVWHLRSLVTLICMPIFNLFLVALSFSASLFSWIEPVLDFFMNTFVGTLLVVAFSVPLFLVYYYIYLFRKFCDSKDIRAITVILSIYCAVYSVMRLFDKSILPMMDRFSIVAPEQLTRIMSLSSEMSLGIYLIAFVGFIFLQLNIYEEMKKKTAGNGDEEEKASSKEA